MIPNEIQAGSSNVKSVGLQSTRIMCGLVAVNMAYTN